LELKNKINKNISEGQLDQLAIPKIENCMHCEYRPICNIYNTTNINNFENKNVDIYGVVIDVKGLEKKELKIQLENKVLIIKNIYTNESIKIGDSIFIYNLFCPDGNSQILFAMKQTIIKYE
jgi:hypothetical protein